MDTEQENLNKDWDSRSVGKPWQHKFFYFVIRSCGRRVAYLFMYFVVLWYVLFYPPLHKKCRPYLDRRFPDRKTRLARLLDEYRWITSLGKSLIDRAVFGILGAGRIKVEVPEGARLQELLDEKNGLLILGAHTGCWQIAFSELQFLEGSVHIVIHRDQYDVDKHYFEHKHRKPPFEIIDPAGYLGGTLQMAALLQEGQTVGLMGDRVFGNDSNTVTVDFLGDPIRIPVAPYRLAAMQGTPIAVVFSYRANRSRYITEIPGVIRVPAAVDRNSRTYLPYAQEFIGYLTRYVQKHPFDFLNFYPMWKECASQNNVVHR
ncbi:MAG: lipid A biosynthesis acyltransferase [Planctomycetes bacterium B3_Pla]|nr:MAG: lipid A biosynthesis acyltransferase [Planctomycetes bacterium B3_Pla]